MNYIYGYCNKINNKWYIGQTTMPIKERHRLHLSGAKNEGASDYNCLFHKKIREYGIDNFELIVLEEVEDISKLDEREIYWIKEKNSFVKNNQGYNLTTGGQKRKNNEDYWDIRSSLSKQQALEIIDLLKHSQLSQVEIANKYNINVSIVNGMNVGKKYHLLPNEEYPIRKKTTEITSQEKVKAIIALLQQGYNNIEIHQMLNVGVSTISSINSGKRHRQKDIEYPIRKETNVIKFNKEKSEIIKTLLETTQLNNKQIADRVGCDPSVVSRINTGKTYKDLDRKYPIRK